MFYVLDKCSADANLQDDEGCTQLSICLSSRGLEILDHFIAEQLVCVLGADATKEQSCFDNAVAEARSVMRSKIRCFIM